MEDIKMVLEFDQKRREFKKNKEAVVTENTFLVELDNSVVQLYQNSEDYPALMPHLDINVERNRRTILVKSWGYQLSTLSQYQIQSFCKQTWLQIILTTYINMKTYSPRLSEADIYLQNNEDPRFLPIISVSVEDYLQNFKKMISKIFGHLGPIVQKSQKISKFQEVQAWLRDLLPKKPGKTISQLLELKNAIPKNVKDYRIRLTQDQKEWILSLTEHKVGTTMQLVYDGLNNSFQPSPLLKIAQNQLLFLIETTHDKRIAFWMATKPEILSNALFGTYYGDKTKKSVILGLEKRSVHRLAHQNYSVGFGNQILLSIGKLDFIFSAFNCQNISYFPYSYTQDEEKGVRTAQDLLGNVFKLKQMQVYKLN